MAPSYAHGAGTAPLLGETIGENLDSTIARFGDREALVSVYQNVRFTYAELGRQWNVSPGHCLPWALGPGTASASGVRTARSGCSCSTRPRRPASCWSTSTPPIARRSCPTCCASRAAVRSSPRAFKSSDYAGMVDEVRGDLPEGSRTWCTWSRTSGGRWSRARTPSCRTGDAVRRADQHPVHERHHRLSQGRHAQPPQHPQQRLLRGRGLRLYRARPGLHPGAVLPLLRHGPRQPGLRRRTGPAWSSRRPHSTPSRRSRRSVRALHEPLRRADDVHRRARARTLRRVRPVSSLRTGIMAGSPCPIETMRRVVTEMHMDEVTIYYGMTETSPVSRRPAPATRWRSA